MDEIGIYNYGGGSSPTSQIKAMKVNIGEFTLYFSYNTLIAFTTSKEVFMTEYQHSHTTAGHKSSVGNWWKQKRIPDKLLQMITYSNLTKLPFKEVMKFVGIQNSEQ